MRKRAFVIAAVAAVCACLVAAFGASSAAAQPIEGSCSTETPCVSYCIDNATFTTNDTAFEEYLNETVIPSGGKVYGYEGPGAQDITGHVYTDTDDDLAADGVTRVAAESLYTEFYDEDDALDTALYEQPAEGPGFNVNTHTVAAGACRGGVFADIDHVQVCESPNFSDNLVTISVEDWLKYRGLGARKPVATPGYTPVGQNSGFAGKLGLKCLGNPKAQADVGVEVGDGAVLQGRIFDPDFNPGTYGLAT